MAAKTSEKFPEKTAVATVDNKASAARERELDAAISSITKAYGDGAIMRLGDARAQKKIEVIPTGGLAIDLALVHADIAQHVRRQGLIGIDP